MRIVVDTNVLVSGVFFGGPPRRVIQAVQRRLVEAGATPDIMREYVRVVDEMIKRGAGRLDTGALTHFLASLDIVIPRAEVQVCRDPDDDKFIACALDVGAVYVVSGDKDLLTLGSYEGVEMVTASDFCERYL